MRTERKVLRSSVLFLLLVVLVSSCKIPYRKKDRYPPKATVEVDEMPHFKNSLEWWYLTGHLQDTITKKWYGVEYVFFHYTPVGLKDYFLVNVAVSDPNNDQFYYDYRFDRLNKLLRPDSLPFDFQVKAKKELWTLKGGLGNYELKAKMNTHPVGIDLKTSIGKPVLLHSGTGYENYGDLAKAGYYSYTRMPTTGTLQIGDREIGVAGELWYDRQWNCVEVMQTRVRWDWLAIQFEDSRDELMLYQVHEDNKDGQILWGGTYYTASGENRHLDHGDIELIPTSWWSSEKTGRRYATTWKVIVKSENLELDLKADFSEQELRIKFPLPGLSIDYWEGMCTATGNKNGKPVRGQAYLEMTRGEKARKADKKK